MRQLRSVRRSLSADTMRALVQAFVHCKLDYCNSLMTDAADVHFKRLLSVQNAAARLVSGARRHDHITAVLTKLHWLPVHKRVMFKTVVLVWKCLNGIPDTSPNSAFLLLCFRSSASQVSLDGLTTSSQSPNHERQVELRCRGTVTAEQSSCCSTETRDDSEL